jgi:inosine/xanthosine triphosphate pyrophosphatase family protein
MEEIIIGTTNEAKVAQIRGALAPIGVTVNGIGKETVLPHIAEDGKTALENARKKATAYAKVLHTTVLSMDNALYFDGLSLEEQPGLNVRRIPSNSERPSDEEMLHYYSALVKRFGERTTGRWEFGICVATPDGKYKETTILSPRIFTSTSSTVMVPGYPLESIQIDPETEKYISEMSQEEQDRFWQRAIGTPLQEFIKSFNILKTR